MLDISFGSQKSNEEEPGEKPAKPQQKAYFKDELLRLDAVEQLAGGKVRAQ
jgi:hypothetical protein